MEGMEQHESLLDLGHIIMVYNMSEVFNFPGHQLKFNCNLSVAVAILNKEM